MTGIGELVTRCNGTAGFEGDGRYIRYMRSKGAGRFDTRSDGGFFFCIDNVTQVDTWGGGTIGGGCLYIPRADVFSCFFSLLVRRFFGGYLVLYRDTGQGTAQGLDNAAGSSLGHALSRHIYIG